MQLPQWDGFNAGTLPVSHQDTIETVLLEAITSIGPFLASSAVAVVGDRSRMAVRSETCLKVPGNDMHVSIYEQYVFIPRGLLVDRINDFHTHTRKTRAIV